MFKIYPFVFICTSSFTAFAQDLDPIETDRPDQTESPILVPAKRFQIENGISLEIPGNKRPNLQNTETLMRWGINERIELRLASQFISDRKNNFSGFTPAETGVKIKITEENGLIPHISFLGHLLFPEIASEKFKANNFAPTFRFTFQHNLTHKFSFSYNTGAEWNGATPQATFIYTVAAGLSITEKLSTFLEIFGDAPEKNKAQHRADAGFMYLLKNNIQFDISAGTGITKNASGNFIALGFSFRIKD